MKKFKKMFFLPRQGVFSNRTQFQKMFFSLDKEFFQTGNNLRRSFSPDKKFSQTRNSHKEKYCLFQTKFQKKETSYNRTKESIYYHNKYRRPSHKERNSSESQEVLENQTIKLMKSTEKNPTHTYPEGSHRTTEASNAIQEDNMALKLRAIEQPSQLPLGHVKIPCMT